MSTHETLLTAKSLCAWYGAAQILYDVDLEVRRGEVVALMGRNGAGKSTTLKALIGMLTKRKGAVSFLGQDISKQQQTSDWGAPEINDAQREYAASDVRYLHALKEKLDERLTRENRMDLAQACFDFLPARALLDLAGWPEQDIFAHV